MVKWCTCGYVARPMVEFSQSPLRILDTPHSAGCLTVVPKIGGWSPRHMNPHSAVSASACFIRLSRGSASDLVPGGRQEPGRLRESRQNHRCCRRRSSLVEGALPFSRKQTRFCCLCCLWRAAEQLNVQQARIERPILAP